MACDTDVAVIGAGPYGLAVTAHLRAAGLETRIFGDVMRSWRTQMPSGMVLRSSVRASSIAHPEPGYTVPAWAQRHDRRVQAPIPIADFLEYAGWFADRAVPGVDRRRVETVSRAGGGGFMLRLDDGTQLAARHVVVALGLENSARRPPEFDDLPPESLSHVGDNRPIEEFRGRRVIVVGSGQSALETAALLHEADAAVSIVTRSDVVRWLPPLDEPPGRLPHAPTDVGGFATGWLAAAPDVYRVLPARTRRRVDWQCLRPIGAHSLRARLGQVPIHVGEEIEKASAPGDEVELAFHSGLSMAADHVLLATGFDVDVRRFGLLDAGILDSIRWSGTVPQLRSGYESSVRGLHFVGATAVPSFGPINRFVTGTWYAAPAVTRRVLGRRGPAWKVAF